MFILGRVNIKDISIKLKEKREENGVSIEEASEDLKVRPSQIESLEQGIKEDFKDVVFLKYLIRDYAKYLGLDGDKLVDEFNEFLFDFTSKIPVDDIEKAKENNVKNKEVLSPYTNSSVKDSGRKTLVISILVVLVLMVAGFLIASHIRNNDFQDENITYTIRR